MVPCRNSNNGINNAHSVKKLNCCCFKIPKGLRAVTRRIKWEEINKGKTKGNVLSQRLVMENHDNEF